MKSFLFITAAFIIMLGSCKQELADNKDEVLPSRINLRPGTNTHGSTPNSVDAGADNGDYYVIEGILFENDQLVVTVGYSGGCATHDFEIQGKLLPMDSYPLQASLAIVHDANSDNCEAWITEDIEIDLSALIGTNNADLHIFNPSQAEMRYSFLAYRHIPQGNSCEIATTFEDVICGTGIYGNKWFKVKDEELYLQPVSIKLSVDDNLLQEGKSYKVGFWNTHWSGDSTATCLAYPGPSVMAEISCIELVN